MKFSFSVFAASLAVIFGGLSLGPVAALADNPASINLGSASNFVILAKTGISTTGATSVVGDIGVSPAAATYITGFALTLPVTSAFSTSALVSGKVYAPGYADPTPANLTTAIGDIENAYTDGVNRPAGTTELGAGNIGGLTLTSGVYKWGTGVTIPTDVILSGSANDVWIFQIAQNLNLSSGVKIILAGGAKASNIFWVVGGQTTIGTTAVLNGNILDQTAIVLNTGAILNGRALAQTAVTLDASAVSVPGGSASVPAVPAIPAIPATSSSGSGTNNSVVPVSTATPAVPATPEDQALQNQVDALLVAIHSLQAQKVSQQGSSTFGQQVKAIIANLGSGSRSSNVSALQKFLISQDKGSAARALGQVGPTAYFGNLTKAALAEFQAKVGIKPARGNFGPITRIYLKANY